MNANSRKSPRFARESHPPSPRCAPWRRSPTRIASSSTRTIESQLLQLNEDFLLGEINEDDCAFKINDALLNVPMPNRPAHLLVMKRVTQWCTNELITAAKKKELLA